MLLIVIIHWQHSLIGLSAASLPYNLVLSGTLKAILQEGGFQLRSSLDVLSPVSKVCGVFSNRRWPSTSERQARATTKSFIVLGVIWTTAKNLGWGSSCLVLGGDVSLWSSGDHFSPSGIISLKIFMSTHTFYVKVYKMVKSCDPLKLYEMHLVLYFFLSLPISFCSDLLLPLQLGPPLPFFPVSPVLSWNLLSLVPLIVTFSFPFLFLTSTGEVWRRVMDMGGTGGTTVREEMM